MSAILFWTSVRSLLCLALLPRHGRAGAIGELVTAAFQRLGGGFLKIGQVLSTRVDLFPPESIAALGQLQDSVLPCPVEDAIAVLERSWGRHPSTVFSTFDTVPVGSGAIAQVHRAVLRANGKRVAVKIRRPGITRLVQVDAGIVLMIAAVVARLPACRGIPVREGLQQVTSAVLRQTDFRLEAGYHREFRASFPGDHPVRVPEVFAEHCTDEVLLSDFVPSVKITDARLDDVTRRRAVVRTLEALYQMLFSEGLVHCDLHPGNILVADDSSVTIVDFGFVARMAARERLAFARLFLAIAFNDGVAAANLLIDTASWVPHDLDRAVFHREVATLIGRVSGARAGQFLIATFVQTLFQIQRQHRIRASAEFSMAILALMIYEGTIRKQCPDLDFQKEAVGPLLRALQATHALGASPVTVPSGAAAATRSYD